MTTVAIHLVEALVHAGVRRNYRVVGDSLNSSVDAVHHNKKIQWIHVRHEEAGALAACAEAQLTGSLASAPEVVVRGISISSMDYSTLPRRLLRCWLFQDCSYFCQLVGTEKQMPRSLQIAMQTSISRGGVSVLVLPGDVASSQMTSKDLEHRTFHPSPAIQPSATDPQKLAVLLNDAGRVTLFAGAGCANAHSEVLELANRLQAPIAYTFRGKEFLEHDNPNGTGMTGLLGTESGHYSRRRLT
jgi:pyruvate dehydrogenase (quinone)